MRKYRLFPQLPTSLIYTVPKTRQISEKIREEVPWRENVQVIRGNDENFPRITGKFSLRGTSSSLPTKICQMFGTVKYGTHLGSDVDKTVIIGPSLRSCPVRDEPDIAT
jgi:hypothetical protein